MFFAIGLIALAVLPQDHSNGTWWEVRHAELSKLLPQVVCLRRVCAFWSRDIKAYSCNKNPSVALNLTSNKSSKTLLEDICQSCRTHIPFEAMSFFHNATATLVERQCSRGHSNVCSTLDLVEPSPCPSTGPKRQKTAEPTWKARNQPGKPSNSCLKHLNTWHSGQLVLLPCHIDILRTKLQFRCLPSLFRPPTNDQDLEFLAKNVFQNSKPFANPSFPYLVWMVKTHKVDGLSSSQFFFVGFQEVLFSTSGPKIKDQWIKSDTKNTKKNRKKLWKLT